MFSLHDHPSVFKNKMPPVRRNPRRTCTKRSILTSPDQSSEDEIDQQNTEDQDYDIEGNVEKVHATSDLDYEDLEDENPTNDLNLSLIHI